MSERSGLESSRSADAPSGSAALVDAWRINARVTSFLVEHLTPDMWHAALSSSPRRPVARIAVHLHNARRLWLKSLGRATGATITPLLPPTRTTAAQLLPALAQSGAAIEAMIDAGIRNGGRFPGVASGFVYGAMPRDVALFVSYALSHEAHHRGQIVTIAREAGHRLPQEVVTGLWQWSSRLKEAHSAPPTKENAATKR